MHLIIAVPNTSIHPISSPLIIRPVRYGRDDLAVSVFEMDIELRWVSTVVRTLTKYRWECPAMVTQ